MGRRPIATLLLVALLGAAARIDHHAFFVGPTTVVAQQRRASTVVARMWVDTKVAVEVPADPGRCYALYSKLEEHPRWSPWLRSVVFVDPVRTYSRLPL